MTKRIFITQGEHGVSADQGATISTILGSCVACCLWDPVAGVGGMNHILLAANSNSPTDSNNMSGVNAMELLINDLLKLGAVRTRLLAKAFGGASMIAGLSDIGATNCAFALEYLKSEGIECVSNSLGGDSARQVIFTPSTGAARVKTTQSNVATPVPPAPKAPGNDLELF